jgi:hypothetical protein
VVIIDSFDAGDSGGGSGDLIPSRWIRFPTEKDILRQPLCS